MMEGQGYQSAGAYQGQTQVPERGLTQHADSIYARALELLQRLEKIGDQLHGPQPRASADSAKPQEIAPNLQLIHRRISNVFESLEQAVTRIESRL